MKYFKLIGIMSLLVFSFYLTDFVTELAINSNSLMKTIKNNSDEYFVKSVNAIIEDNTIIPGIKGKKVNELESFLNMKDFGAFNINYLIYDEIKPEISLEDNKDKIIISGNKKLRNISLLIKDNIHVLEYLEKNNIKYSKLIDSSDSIIKHENINIENEKDKFKNLDILLERKNLNKKICILNYSNIELCKENKYYIVKPTVELTNNNLLLNLRSDNIGGIILINDNLSIENFKVFLSSIKGDDIEIMYLSELIKE